MQPIPLRTTVIGSYPFPGWLEFAVKNLHEFGNADKEEMIEDAVIAAIHDQVTAGLDVITDGEQTRLDFNLSFYGYLKGIKENTDELRKFGPAAHDQRGKNSIVDTLAAPNGLGVIKEFKRLQRLAPVRSGIKSKCSRSVYIKRPSIAQYTIPRPLCHHGGPITIYKKGIGRSCSSRLQGNYRR